MDAAGVKIERTSSLYLTEPVDDPDLYWFLNCIAAIRQPPPPAELLGVCLQTESHCGRSSSRERPLQRTLDIDILLYGDRTCAKEDLTIPHPRLHLRRFVLQPLAEIAPDAWHPLLRKEARQMLRELASAEQVFLLASTWSASQA